MNITSAKYREKRTPDSSEVTSRVIETTIDGVEMTVPTTVGNRHYDEIMRQVDAGTLTIADAE